MKPRSSSLPVLDPSQNYHLTSEGRPEHSPTTLAPKSMLRRGSPANKGDVERRSKAIEDQLRKSIGLPYYAQNGFILYKGDCCELMSKLATSGVRVDLTVTSPPYNIGKEYETPQALDKYIDWCTRWLSQIHTLTAPSGALWLNLGYFQVPGKGLCVPIPYLLWDRTPFYLLQEVIWHYGAGVATKSRFCPRNEKWLFYVRDSASYTFNLDNVRDPNVKYPNSKKNGKLRCNPLGKNPSDVWSFPKVTTGANRSSKERTEHPAQFPLGVVDRIIKASSNALDLVMDPFSGSGSTGIAAVGNGRVYLGFEIREDYCQMAAARFEKFIEKRKQGERQAGLFEE